MEQGRQDYKLGFDDGSKKIVTGKETLSPEEYDRRKAEEFDQETAKWRDEISNPETIERFRKAKEILQRRQTEVKAKIEALEKDKEVFLEIAELNRKGAIPFGWNFHEYAEFAEERGWQRRETRYFENPYKQNKTPLDSLKILDNNYRLMIEQIDRFMSGDFGEPAKAKDLMDSPL